MSALGVPVDVEKSEISSALNTTNLNIFLMGMYKLSLWTLFSEINSIQQECILQFTLEPFTSTVSFQIL